MRRLVSFVLAILLTVSFTGCEKLGGNGGGGDWIVDWVPVSLFLRVVDEGGKDLLDPENPNNLIDGTSITFKGKTYSASRQWYEAGRPNEMPATKAILAQIYGLFLVNGEMFFMNSNTAGFSLFFGEIDGARDMDEDLVVTLPNGMTGTIHYHCSNHNERKLSCDRSWKFNGAKHEGNIFTFVVSN